jgi:small subunit ribosomal protein S21
MGPLITRLAASQPRQARLYACAETPAWWAKVTRLPIEEQCYAVQVLVRDNNVDQALRALKKKMQREGIFREMKLRRNYEKPSERKAREKAEAVRRHRKLLRKRMDREGY